MRTEKAEFHMDGVPNVIPGIPTLDPAKTTIVPLRAAPSRVLAQPHPYTWVEAIIWPPEKLAEMGIPGLDKPHALRSFDHGQAEIEQERRDPSRVTSETAKKLGMALNGDDKAIRHQINVVGAKARLEKHMNELGQDIVKRYLERMTKVLPPNHEVSDEEVRSAYNGMQSVLRDTSPLAAMISKESVAAFLRNSVTNARETAFADFNREDNFAWEECACTVLRDVLNRSSAFECSLDVRDELLGVNPITIELDNNPNHSLTLKLISVDQPDSSPARLSFILNHESGESIYDRVDKRRPPRSSSTERSRCGRHGAH